MYQRMLNIFVQSWRDERGNMTLLSTALIVMSMTIVLPIAWNWGVLFTVRNQSQNGSDAGSLAAAESVARELNAAGRDWWDCVPPKTPPQIVRRYVETVVVPVGGSGNGGGAAEQYAAQNRSTINDYAQWVQRMAADGVHAKAVDGVTVPPVRTAVEGSAQIQGTLIEGLYGFDGTPVNSRARAEAYLYSVRSWQTPCPTDPEAIAQHYTFRWRIRLIDAKLTN